MRRDRGCRGRRRQAGATTLQRHARRLPALRLHNRRQIIFGLAGPFGLLPSPGHGGPRGATPGRSASAPASLRPRPGLMSGCSIGPTRFLYLVENASNLTLPDFHPLPLPVASRDSTSILDFCTSGHTSSGCQSVFPIAHGHSDGLCRKEAVASRENDQSEQKFRTAVAWHRRALGHRTRDAHVGPIYSTVRQFAAAPDGP
jgi:hypothetical protein